MPALKALIREGWSHVSQEFINRKVRELPYRLKAVLANERAMTGY